MNFVTQYPSSWLKDYVRYYWTMESDCYELLPEQIVYPEGTTDIFFHYGDPFRVRFDNNTQMQPHSFFCGQKTSSAFASLTGKSGLFAVTFTSFGASIFFNLPFSELRNANLELGSFLGDKINILQNDIYNAGGIQRRIEIIEKYLLLNIIEKSLYELEPLKRAMNCIKTNPLLFNVEKIASAACLSFRQLDRAFQKRIGLAPKEFLRIERINFAIGLMKARSHISLTNVALDAGFYDQSHFINDFKSIVGITPKKFCSLDCV